MSDSPSKRRRRANNVTSHRMIRALDKLRGEIDSIRTPPFPTLAAKRTYRSKGRPAATGLTALIVPGEALARARAGDLRPMLLLMPQPDHRLDAGMKFDLHTGLRLGEAVVAMCRAELDTAAQRTSQLDKKERRLGA